MDNQLVVTRWFVVFMLCLMLASCAPTPVSISTVTATAIPTLLPTASATTTSTLAPPVQATLTPLPTNILPPPPNGHQWPVQNAQDLKQQIQNASVIVVRMQNFLYCPSAYDESGKLDQKVCADLEFELDEEQRQNLIEALPNDETQAGDMPYEDMPNVGNPTYALPYPEFALSMILPQFRLHLWWTTENNFHLTENYYAEPLQDIWDLGGQLRQGDTADVGFLQQRSLLYNAVRKLLPKITFPPEHPASLLAYERAVVEYDGKKCAYGNENFPSFRPLILGLLDASIPVKEARPSGQPRAIFTFWVRGQAYTLEIWNKQERFFYQGTTYKYIFRTFGPAYSLYVGPLPSTDLEDFLINLAQSTECKAP